MLTILQIFLITLAIVVLIYGGVYFKNHMEKKYDYTMDHDVMSHAEFKNSAPDHNLDNQEIKTALSLLTKDVHSLKTDFDSLSRKVESLQFASGMRAEQLGYATSSVNALSQIVNNP